MTRLFSPIDPIETFLPFGRYLCDWLKLGYLLTCNKGMEFDYLYMYKIAHSQTLVVIRIVHIVEQRLGITRDARIQPGASGVLRK